MESANGAAADAGVPSKATDGETPARVQSRVPAVLELGVHTGSASYPLPPLAYNSYMNLETEARCSAFLSGLSSSCCKRAG